MKLNDLRHAKWFDAAYRIGVGIKGLDGLAELVAGIALIISPTIIHTLLGKIIETASTYDGSAAQFVVHYTTKLDSDLSQNGLTFLIVFLIGHGVVKLVLVYCLLRRILWAYPYALGVLVLFLFYQLYIVALDPTSLGLWFFTLLDIIIIWLVWGEWQDLKEKEPA